MSERPDSLPPFHNHTPHCGVRRRAAVAPAGWRSGVQRPAAVRAPFGTFRPPPPPPMLLLSRSLRAPRPRVLLLLGAASRAWTLGFATVQRKPISACLSRQESEGRVNQGPAGPAGPLGATCAPACDRSPCAVESAIDPNLDRAAMDQQSQLPRRIIKVGGGGARWHAPCPCLSGFPGLWGIRPPCRQRCWGPQTPNFDLPRSLLFTCCSAGDAAAAE
jgi:hypothetical protein